MDIVRKAEALSPRIAALRALKAELLQALTSTLYLQPAYTQYSNDGPAVNFVTDTTLYRLEGYTGPRVRWMLDTTMAKATDGFTFGGVRINVFHSQSSCAPNFDVEVYDYGQSLLMYLNLPARTDLVLNGDYLDKHYIQPGAADISLQQLLQQIYKDEDTTLFWSPSPHVRMLQGATGITVMMPATDASVAKVGGWARTALSLFLELAGRPGSAMLDPVVQAQLAQRDGVLLHMFRKDADLPVLEKEFGKEGMESILRMATCDESMLVDGRN